MGDKLSQEATPNIKNHWLVAGANGTRLYPSSPYQATLAGLKAIFGFGKTSGVGE